MTVTAPLATDSPLHRTLERQLRRLGLCCDPSIPADRWQRLVQVVSNSYAEADSDRYMLERSIEVASVEMRGLYDKLFAQSRTDSLTGLPNRTDLLSRLDDALKSVDDPESVALLFVDLDGFKRTNDTFGHAFGDELLTQVAQRIRATVRREDEVARLGGDEFVVLCVDLHDRSPARAVADRVVAALDAPFCVAGETVYIGGSVGLARADSSSGGADLVRRADMAMYEAKAEGRSRCVAFDERMEAKVSDRVTIERELRRGIAEGELVMHFQPVMSLRTGDPVGAEALVRWERPGFGLVMPDAFIPIAEDSKLIHTLTAEVLRLACDAAATWRSPDLLVAVNLSARDLHNDDLADLVRAVTGAAGLDPRRLVIELTESSLLIDGPMIATNLAKLRALGARVAVDDFGTGYSSLSYLRRLPVEVLKIDRSFVMDIDEDPAAAAIVRAIIEMGHALGLEIVAEGVERAAQADELRRLGCDSAQGYYFARPAPMALLAERVPQLFG